jgi:hypothetical protein
MSQRSLFGEDVFPRSSVTTKLPTYREPAGAPMSEPEQQAYRDLIVDFVSIAWRRLHRAVNLQEIYDGIYFFSNGIAQDHLLGVKERVQSRIQNELWPYAPFVRSKRTVDRRVNESASDAFYEDNISRLACVSPGIYQPSPRYLSMSR